MAFLITASVIYSSAGNRTTALTSINSAIAAVPSATATASSAYSAGTNSVSTATVTLSYRIEDEAIATTLYASLMTATASATKAAAYGNISMNRVA